MFNKFQQSILKILENVASVATSNSVGGGVFGPNSTENTFANTSIRGDMSIAGGVNPKRKRKKFPIIRRSLKKNL